MAGPEKEKLEIISSEQIYHGRVFDVTVATIREDDQTYKREIVNHPGSAVIIPVFDNGTVALVEQYRHPARRFMLEVPAGTLSPGEPPEDGARRELEEEVGVRAGQMEKLSEFFVSPGFLEEKMNVFLATGLTQGDSQWMDDERIETRWFTELEIDDLIRRGKVEDGKTLIGFLTWRRYYRT